MINDVKEKEKLINMYTYHDRDDWVLVKIFAKAFPVNDVASNTFVHFSFYKKKKCTFPSLI